MNNAQRYVSAELTHFVGRGRQPSEQYDLLKRILSSGTLGSHPPGSAPISLTVNWGGSSCENSVFSPQVICFCDIPLADLNIHMRKYSQVGVAFSKTFLAGQGATPVFYLAKNVAGSELRCEYFDRMLKVYRTATDRVQSNSSLSPDERREFGDLQRFFEFLIFSHTKFFDETLPDDHIDNYYMEREWRVMGSVRFGLSEVERGIIPRSFATEFRREVPAYLGQLHFVE